MPSLVLVKEQYFHSSFPFRLLGVEFSTRATRLATRVARAKIECGWVVNMYEFCVFCSNTCLTYNVETRKKKGKVKYIKSLFQSREERRKKTKGTTTNKSKEAEEEKKKWRLYSSHVMPDKSALSMNHVFFTNVL
jgi:hypothetical protein